MNRQRMQEGTNMMAHDATKKMVKKFRTQLNVTTATMAEGAAAQ